MGGRVPTCGDYEPRIFRLPLALVCAPHRHCSEAPDIFPMACDRRLATTGQGVVLRVPTCGVPHTSSKSALTLTPGPPPSSGLEAWRDSMRGGRRGSTCRGVDDPLPPPPPPLRHSLFDCGVGLARQSLPGDGGLALRRTSELQLQVARGAGTMEATEPPVQEVGGGPIPPAPEAGIGGGASPAGGDTGKY